MVLFITLTTQITALANSSHLSNKISSPPNDSSAMVENVKSFFTFYKINYSKANDFNLITTDSMGNYQVEIKECKAYLDFLSTSGYLSALYTDEWTSYFNERAISFKINPQNEGPPEGFDYDLVTLTQEPELVFNHVHDLKFNIVSANESVAKLIMKGEWTYIVNMHKENGIWKMSSINHAE